MTMAELMAEVEKDAIFSKHSGGGLSLSCGEPFLQAEFTTTVLKTCKAKGIHSVVDTCGQTQWFSIEQSRAFVELFLFR